MSEELARIACEATRVGAKLLLRRFRDVSLEAEMKGAHDYVSAADRESEAAILSFLEKSLPGHSVLSEEAGFSGSADTEYRWIVDPLDGTNNYLRGLPIWGISIACLRHEDLVAAAILDPIGDNLFSASVGGGARWNGEVIQASQRQGLEGSFLATGYPFRARGAIDAYLKVFRSVFLQAGAIRRCGSASLDLAYTAAGVFDGFFEFRLSAWDIAAGALLIREAGGQVSDLDGQERFLQSGNVVAGGSGVYDELLAAVREFVSEADLDKLAPVGDRD